MFQKATFLKDANIINITLEQIRNKTFSTTGSYSNETLTCVGVLIGRESVSLPGKIPGAFYTNFRAINNIAYVLHGFKYLGEKPAKLGSLWKHKLLHVSKNYIHQLNICWKNLSNIRTVTFPVWCTKESWNSLRVKPLFSLRRQMKSFFLDEKSVFGPVLAFSVAKQSLLLQLLIVSKEQTSSRKSCETSNWEGLRPVKCFMRANS